MLNTLLVSTWAILVTLGIFYLQQPGSKDADVEEAPVVIFGAYKTGTVSTAVFNGGAIAGHFVTKVSFQLPKEDYKKLQVPIEFLIGDQLFSILNAMNIKEMKAFKNEDHQKIADNLGEALHVINLPVKNITFEDTEILSK